MDDYENKRVRLLRGVPDQPDQIPPEKRGKKACSECNGKGGRYIVREPKLNTATWEKCKFCQDGEIP